MGIRYDKDARRATNGPLIFFSDAMSQGALSEEIRGAIISGLSFYAYHEPGAGMISYGSSEGFVEGIGEPGFVIGMFDPNKPYITIPYLGAKPYTGEGWYRMPEVSTPRDKYEKEVKAIISHLRKIGEGKVVAARVEISEENVDLAEIFYRFINRFPEAFIFCFSTPATGCWIGASPELLLECKEGIMSTMALAGTRQAYTEGEWDEKNIKEQEIVVDYICKTLQEAGFEPQEGDPYTRITGDIEHICTPIFVEMNEQQVNIEKLLRVLSPTPALCGEPKEFALEEIRKHEDFDRGCYGGFCGPYHSLNNFLFHVVLRCGAVDERKICKYAGGGITSQSEVTSEWQETESKLKNVWG